MKKSDLIIGTVIGLVAALVGSAIFIALFIDAEFRTAVSQLRDQEQIGKIITLGAVVNLLIFFALLHYKREMMARGVVLATILLALTTFFI